MNRVSEHRPHPLALNGQALQMLAQWLKCNAARQARTSDPRRMMIERYPADLFSEAELQALWDVMQG
ncbi:hypothetical protein SAMN04487857_114136 [Pseudomonas sp. ok272]|uniref:hypothetical protein n=1 Tax=unclassified Pseudomonas TaxID=196821 RepID=UPI0008B180EF|nr:MULTISPECIES: hypothetical protein [unclassified Pseudomonas]SEN36653.1 hypothetical protein SAMN04487857_114136 [Pseudomonas sp. ok272]SFM82374.1 hypothetical protein SAMN04487858_10797 [Pseudomonas sp. ok602]